MNWTWAKKSWTFFGFLFLLGFVISSIFFIDNMVSWKKLSSGYCVLDHILWKEIQKKDHTYYLIQDESTGYVLSRTNQRYNFTFYVDNFKSYVRESDTKSRILEFQCYFIIVKEDQDAKIIMDHSNTRWMILELMIAFLILSLLSFFLCFMQTTAVHPETFSQVT